MVFNLSNTHPPSKTIRRPFRIAPEEERNKLKKLSVRTVMKSVHVLTAERQLADDYRQAQSQCENPHLFLFTTSSTGECGNVKRILNFLRHSLGHRSVSTFFRIVEDAREMSLKVNINFSRSTVKFSISFSSVCF